jgi:hypothetical protein
MRRIASPAMKIIVAIGFILILASLGSALFFLMRDKGSTNRTVRALAFRVGFSITLFILLLVAYRLGYIQPTGIGLR